MRARRAALLLAAAAAGGAGYRYAAAGRRLPAGPGRRLTVDGEDLHFVEAGQGPALVLIHGLAASLFSWRAVFEDLARDHRVVALDLPGFGFSTRRPAAPLTHSGHARRVASLLDALGIDSAIVAGHSMGGAIAQRFALDFPGRTRALLLIASVDASQPVDWEERQRRGRPVIRAAGPVLALGPVGRAAVRRALSTAVFDPSCITPAMVDGYLRPLQVGGTVRCLLQMAADSAGEPPAELGSITAPALVIAGENDRVIASGITRGLAAAIPGAGHVVIPRTGHLPAEEQPGAFLATIREFCLRLPAPAIAG